MKEITQEKSLMKVNQNSIFYKIKNFFRRLFVKTEKLESYNTVQNDIDNSVNNEEKKNNFMEEIRNIETEETKLLNLQNQYHSGVIKEEDLTQEQAKSLCALYDKQIESLRKSNKIRKQKLLEYRKRLQTEN